MTTSVKCDVYKSCKCMKLTWWEVNLNPWIIFKKWGISWQKWFWGLTCKHKKLFNIHPSKLIRFHLFYSPKPKCHGRISYIKIAMAYSHIALFDILLNINMYIFLISYRSHHQTLLKIIPELSLLEEHLNGSSYLDVQSCTGVQELF